MPRKGEPMPMEMQKEVIVRILRATNRRNPAFVDDDEIRVGSGPSDVEYWPDHLDETLTLPENIDNLKRIYPQVNWEAQEPRPEHTGPRRFLEEQRESGPEGKDYSLLTRIVVQPHKVHSKGKTYLRGRIQLTVDKELIGKEAEVQLTVYDAALPPKYSQPRRLKYYPL